MKLLKIFTAISASAILSSVTIGHSYAADVRGDAGAKIVAPLVITSVQELYFGSIVPNVTESGTVNISPAGLKICGTELTCLIEDHTAASFGITGALGTSYTIALPSSIALSNGSGASMQVVAVAGSQDAGTLITGEDAFSVGGNLQVAANQAGGEYVGTFTVTVEYQ